MNESTMIHPALNGLPKYLRAWLTCIEAVGFPIIACVFMFYQSTYSIRSIERAMQENNTVLRQFVDSSLRFQQGVLLDHRLFMERLEKIAKE